jgi:hypothetical protein
MNFKILFSAFCVLVVLLGCGVKSEKPEGKYQYTNYGNGKKVVFDFRANGDVYVQVSHVNISGKIVDDTFFPFFKDGDNKYSWKIGDNGHLISIHNETDFEIVRLEYTGKNLLWGKTKFTRE